MQLPYRKPGKFTDVETDPLMTQEKFAALKKNLADLFARRPAVADEVHRLAQNGDFSENAEYQAAKGKLRGINHAIQKLEYQIDHAVIIQTRKNDVVGIGHHVAVEIIETGAIRTYQILGSAETNPAAGIISHTSPIGAALMGHAVGDVVKIVLPDRTLEFSIKKIT